MDVPLVHPQPASRKPGEHDLLIAMGFDA
jgi:hypothetical protein